MESDDLNLIAFEGEMYLYEKPELLDAEKHGHLGISVVPGPYRFAAKARAVPIVVSEMMTAQKHYPVVFSSLDEPVLLAVVGLYEGKNLFVDFDGRWEDDVYIPAYLRCHPFAFAEGPDDGFAVVIDRAANTITESPDEPFFDGPELSAKTKSRVDFYGQYGGERQKTRDFCNLLSELGLLSGQEVRRTLRGTPQNLASYIAVDAGKLSALTSEELWELHRTGMLAAIYAHIFSLDNWKRLIDKHARMVER